MRSKEPMLELNLNNMKTQPMEGLTYQEPVHEVSKPQQIARTCAVAELVEFRQSELRIHGILVRSGPPDLYAAFVRLAESINDAAAKGK